MNTNGNKKEKRYYNIEAGPNKDALFDCCKYACSRNVNLPVEFKVAYGYTTPTTDPGCAYLPLEISDIKIHEIGHEDGSGESFNLQGYCKVKLDIATDRPSEEYKPYHFKAYYNSKNRTGCITFEN